MIEAGQAPGEAIGNGRATALLPVYKGAKVLAVDRDLESAQLTADLIIADGGEAAAARADVVVEVDLEAAVCRGRIRNPLRTELGGDRGLGLVTRFWTAPRQRNRSANPADAGTRVRVIEEREQ